MEPILAQELFSDRAAVFILKEGAHLGPKTFLKLMGRFKTPSEVLCAPVPDISSIPGLGTGIAARIQSARDNAHALQGELGNIHTRDVGMVAWGEEGYPPQLRELYNPPLLIYYRGILPINRPAAAIVGTHMATQDGVKLARELGQWLSEQGISVVSGLARGIDTGAHQGCLLGPSTTFAVLGSGLTRVYPSENRALAKAVSNQGGLISEYYPDQPVSAGKLLARNRIIAAWAKVIIAIEPRFNLQGKMEILEVAGKLKKQCLVLKPNITPHPAKEDNKGIRFYTETQLKKYLMQIFKL